MKEEKFMQLLSILEKVRKEDIAVRDATDKYFDVVYPDSYAPTYNGKLDKCLEVLQLFEPDIYRDLEYYFYEAPMIDEAHITLEDGIKYNFCKREEMIHYMRDLKYIT